ncbi:winged helix-turn-helix transcriptional regulator [Marinilactibacillus sp. GCM10026970]|uniref:winged helix-turn-helix transcriptional regulator n=1 Tax=Marinilactibacillus sp. GCM10026970 TaxID=3252642 RepID=UPI003621D985
MKEQTIEKVTELENTGFGFTLSLIKGKHKMLILYLLFEHQTIRHNELKRQIGTISYKSLSCMLKELEKDQLVNRVEFPQIPPKVEYSLTERGKSLMPVINSMCEWGENEQRLAKN